MLFAQTPTVIDPSPWFNAGVGGAVLLTVVVMLVAGKWLVGRLSETFEKVGDKITDSIDKLADKHAEALLAIASSKNATDNVADSIDQHRREADKRHEEIMRILSHRP